MSLRRSFSFSFSSSSTRRHASSSSSCTNRPRSRYESSCANSLSSFPSPSPSKRGRVSDAAQVQALAPALARPRRAPTRPAGRPGPCRGARRRGPPRRGASGIRRGCMNGFRFGGLGKTSAVASFDLSARHGETGCFRLAAMLPLALGVQLPIAQMKAVPPSVVAGLAARGIEHATPIQASGERAPTAVHGAARGDGQRQVARLHAARALPRSAARGREAARSVAHVSCARSPTTAASAGMARSTAARRSRWWRRVDSNDALPARG